MRLTTVALVLVALSAGPSATGAAAQEASGPPQVLTGNELYPLVKALESADADKRDAAVAKLGALGPGKLDDLLAVSFLELGQLIEAKGGPELAWKDPLPEQFLAETARAAAAMGPGGSARLAQHAVSGEMSSMSEISIRALLLLGPRARAVVPTLRRGLDSDDSMVWRPAGKVLAACDAPGYESLREAARSPRADTRGAALAGLGWTRSPSVLEVVLGGLSDRDPGVQFEAREAVAQLGPAAAPALPVLLAREDADPEILAKLGEGVVPALVEALGDKDPALANRAGQTLALMGGAALPALRSALDDPRPSVRIVAADAVGMAAVARTFEELAAMAPRLIALTRDADPRVRAMAVSALGRVGTYVRRTDETMSALRSAAKDQDPQVRAEATVWLAEVAKRGPSS